MTSLCLADEPGALDPSASPVVTNGPSTRSERPTRRLGPITTHFPDQIQTPDFERGDADRRLRLALLSLAPEVLQDGAGVPEPALPSYPLPAPSAWMAEGR